MVAIWHLVLCAALTGLIWFVQIVHYPLFARVPSAAFQVYEKEHQQRTGWVAGPLMVAELGTGFFWIIHQPEILRDFWVVSSFGLLALIWMVTFTVQVPLHRRLLTHPDDRLAIAKLVRSNWWRTLAWTARLFCLIAVWPMAFEWVSLSV